jgi:hypothetical protein
VRKRLVQCAVNLTILFVVALLCATSSVRAQSANDTSAVGPLRPRYGTYLIQSYPSPSSPRSPVTIQFYNHNPEILSVKVYDLANRLIIVLHEKQQTERGLHKYTIQPGKFASGVYFIRLTTYTPSGAENIVDNARFVIVH